MMNEIPQLIRMNVLNWFLHSFVQVNHSIIALVAETKMISEANILNRISVASRVLCGKVT